MLLKLVPKKSKNFDGNLLAYICLDIDECSDKEMCKFGTCYNEPGGYTCQCPESFVLSRNGKMCLGLCKNKFARELILLEYRTNVAKCCFPVYEPIAAERSYFTQTRCCASVVISGSNMSAQY